MKSPRKRCWGTLSVAGAEPVAVTPPRPIIGPLGKKKALVRSPIDVFVIWDPMRLAANWSGMKPDPFRTAQVPLIWNLRAPAESGSATSSARAMTAIAAMGLDRP